MNRFLIASLASLSAMAAGTIHADDAASVDTTATPTRMVVTYSGSLLFIPVSEVGFSAAFPEGTYSASATFHSAGLLRWFDDTDIEANVSGYREGGELRPWRYSHINHASEKGRTVGIEFPDGIATPDINPPFGSMGEPPASEAERTGALDPISALMGLMLGMSAGRDTVCEGSLQIFDGKARYDLRLERGATETVRTRAWRGDALVCRAYLEPINGYDPDDRPTPEEVARPVIMWLAEVGGAHIPVRFQTSTQIGTINVVATSLSVD